MSRDTPRDVIFVTHGEVEIDPEVSVPEWGLNETGRQRHADFAASEAVAGVTSVFSSTERKALEAAAPVAERFGLPVLSRSDLGENDRSATGYLPPDEFWAVVEEFFARPDVAIRGWERARDAQRRIVAAVRACLNEAREGRVLIVAHGGVGTLLRCHLANVEITKSHGQPHPGGGCYFQFDRTMDGPPTEWRAI